MKSLSATVVAAALFVVGVSAQTFQINTPNPPTQCVPTQFSWTGGVAPFFLAINPGGVPGAAALQQYPNLSGQSFTWSSNISAGTSISLELTDSTGANALSAPVTILSGPISSCLNGGSASSTGSAASSPSGTSPVGTSSTGAATSTGPSSTGAASTASTSPAGTSSHATSTASGASNSGSKSGTSTGTSASASGTGAASGSNGAISNAASAGLVGILGAVAAAFLA